jgi:hypothetical protein
MGGHGRSRRGRWWLIVALVAGGLSALTMVLVLAAPRQTIPLTPTNLSKAATLKSLVADADVSPDGDWVAVVWVEEIEGVDRPRGSVWLRWASVNEAEASWSPREPVFSGSPQECAVEAAVAVTGTTAHVVYSVWSPCADDTTQTVISYTTCLLLKAGGGCGAAQTVVSASSAAFVPRLSSMDIALDGGGVPHLVYVQLNDVGSIATVFHREGVSGPGEGVPGSIGDSLNPGIAWSDGEVHVVWEDGEDFEIMYNRKTGTEWNPSATSLSREGGDSEHHPRNPDIAAREGYAVVTWDWQWDLPGLEPDPYIVAYTRYLSDTHEWTPVFEVGTQGGAVVPVADDKLYPDYTPAYTYTSSPGGQYPTSLRYLRPSVTLNKLGMPAVAWHAKGSDYDIQYSRALSMVETLSWGSAYHWSEPAVLNRQASGDTGAPVMAQARVVSPTLHVAYLRLESGDDWETYYEGREPGFKLGPVMPGDHTVFLPLLMRIYIGRD